MSNHFSGPDFTFRHGDPRLDISDLYVFPKPGDAQKTIFIMNVHPSISFNPPGLTASDGFAPEAMYEFRVDNDGDLEAELAYQIRFTELLENQQTATVKRTDASSRQEEVVLRDVPVSSGAQIQVAEAGDHRFYAGARSDPFFADVGGVLNQFQFTASDSLAEADIYSIVLEVPNRALGPNSKLGVWATVMIPAPGGTDGAGWMQVERAGKPETVNFYCQAEDKVAFNTGEPRHDRAEFAAKFAHALEHMGQYSADEAGAVALTLLPDILPYDYQRPAAYPDNGRTLRDDVFDHALTVYTRRPIDDGVGPHADLLADFPYMGPPHRVTSSTTDAARAEAPAAPAG